MTGTQTASSVPPEANIDLVDHSILAERKRLISVERIRGNDRDKRFYTGLPTWQSFVGVYEYFQPKAEYFRSWQGRDKAAVAPKRVMFS